MFKKIMATLLCNAIIFAGFTTSISAAIVDTHTALTFEARAERISSIEAQLTRADVQSAMVRFGVNPEQALLRVASLNDQELEQLNGQINKLPAGGNGFALVGAVFIVLMILEFTGVIDIFKRA